MYCTANNDTMITTADIGIQVLTNVSHLGKSGTADMAKTITDTSELYGK